MKKDEELKISINIYGVKGRSCRYIQCGYETAKGFNGYIVDYEGGGVSDTKGFLNGKEIEWNEEEEINSFEIYEDSDVNAEAVAEVFCKYFEQEEDAPGFYRLKEDIDKNFHLLEGSNIYVLKGTPLINVLETACGQSTFK